jgi:hypothetical protein
VPTVAAPMPHRGRGGTGAGSALNGWEPPRPRPRAADAPLLSSLACGSAVQVQGSVLASTPRGPRLRTLRVRLDEWEVLRAPQPPCRQTTACTGPAAAAAAKYGAVVDDELEVDIDAVQDSVTPQLAAWMAVKGARRLLCAGVGVEVRGELRPARAAELGAEVVGTEGAGGGGGGGAGAVLVLAASALRLVAALPEPSFVARVLRLATPDLDLLFCAGDAPVTPACGAGEVDAELEARAVGAAAVASFSVAVLTGIYQGNACSCPDILRRSGRGQWAWPARCSPAPSRSAWSCAPSARRSGPAGSSPSSISRCWSSASTCVLPRAGPAPRASATTPQVVRRRRCSLRGEIMGLIIIRAD